MYLNNSTIPLKLDFTDINSESVQIMKMDGTKFNTLEYDSI